MVQRYLIDCDLFKDLQNKQNMGDNRVHEYVQGTREKEGEGGEETEERKIQNGTRHKGVDDKR